MLCKNGAMCRCKRINLVHSVVIINTDNIFFIVNVQHQDNDFTGFIGLNKAIEVVAGNSELLLIILS